MVGAGGERFKAFITPIWVDLKNGMKNGWVLEERDLRRLSLRAGLI